MPLLLRCFGILAAARRRRIVSCRTHARPAFVGARSTTMCLANVFRWEPYERETTSERIWCGVVYANLARNNQLTQQKRAVVPVT